MPVTEATYREVAEQDGDNVWELVCGKLRSKPLMTQAHGDAMTELVVRLHAQLDRHAYRVRVNQARTRLPEGDWFVPDVAVVPAAIAGPVPGERGLDEYRGPLPLVVEIWSPSTGGYDIRTKLPRYQERGDLEIWFLHPEAWTLTAWRREPDGCYSEQAYDRDATVECRSLPGVRVRLDELFRA
jgi:Uma2 family endonuclease